MSKQLDKETVIKNKKSAIQQVNKLLEKYINNPSGEYLKKANLISYWLKDYVRYINFEEKFDPKRIIAYNRGDIVKIGFGFNVGNEYGGLHYAVVLDNHNDHSSTVVTVIPLTSIKDSRKADRHDVILGNEIYRLIKVKADAAAKAIREDREQIERDKLFFDAIMQLANQAISNADVAINGISEVEENIEKGEKLLAASQAMIDDLKERMDHLDEVSEELRKIMDEISGMKQGSVALVGQITTVSKMRIYDPKNSKDVLYGITLSEENMEKINEKVKELYVFSK